MNGAISAILILVVLSNFYILSTSRFIHAIQGVAIQGCLISLLPLPEVVAGSWHAIFLAVGTLVVKGIVLPVLLFKVIRSTEEFRVTQPFLGVLASLLLGFTLLGAAFVAGMYIPIPFQANDSLMGAVGLSTILTGILMQINRRKALSQVLGFLIMENGILILSLRISRGLPFVIELAILFDILLAAMIFGGFIQHIHEIFSHTDVSRMRKLKG